MDKQEILKEIEKLKHLDAIDWNALCILENNLKSETIVLLNKYKNDPDNKTIRDQYRESRNAWQVKTNTVTHYLRLRHLRIELAKLEGVDLSKLNPDLTIPEPEKEDKPPNENQQLNLF